MNKTGIIFLTIVSLLFMGENRLSAQQKVVSGNEWNFILGEWVGEGTGKPGEGAGWFTFTKDLQDNILVRKNHTVFPALDGKPETIHDDLLIIYLDNSGALSKAIYFDNEGHVINYAVSFNQRDKSLVLTSEVQQNMPRFRLTYKILDNYFQGYDLVTAPSVQPDSSSKYLSLDNYALSIDFEIAPPGQPESFSKYLSGKAHKKTIK